MSRGQVIATLEALLARVRTRAAEPRRGTSAASSPPLHSAALPPQQPQEEEAPEPATLPPAAPPRPALEAEVVVDISERLESRERLVAAEPMGREEPLQEPAVEVAAAAPAPEMESLPPSALEDEVVEAAEQPPASSRRPVAPEPEAQLAQMAFGAAEPQPARHTPPPESGRLPTAPVEDFDVDVTGVRTAASILSPGEAPPAAQELVPEATRAQLAPSDAVAEVVGVAQAFAPVTFAALLDASLAL